VRVEIADKEMDALRREPRLYVRATVRELARPGKDADKGKEPKEETVFRDVGVHLKGAAGSFRGVDDRPALTLEFGKFVEGQRFHGLSKLHLNNSVQDGTYMHETLCGEFYNAAGVPAARGRVVLVELNDRKLGLYVLKEGFDSVFLGRYFKETKGNLYDGGFLTDVNTPLRRSSGEGETVDHVDLKALAAAAEEPDPAKRWERLQEVLDVDRFISMCAMDAITWHWDGYAFKSNNYRVYHDPGSGKMVFFPHGMDQMFSDPGGPLLPDFGGLVARQLLETKEGRERYRARVKELLEEVYQPDKIAKRVDELKAVIRPALAEVDKGAARDLDGQAEGIKEAIKARAEHLKRQLRERSR
jgi:spore coat protein CotH